MKKIILVLALGMMTFLNYAQTSIFDKFEDLQDVTTVVVNKEAFKMLSKFKGSTSGEAQEYLEMVKNLESLKVFTTENAAIAKDMNDAVSAYLKSAKLTEFMRVKDKDANVKIYVRQGKDENHVSELLMFVNDLQNSSNQEAVILSLTGDIDLNKISAITEAHIPNSGKQLKKE